MFWKSVFKDIWPLVFFGLSILLMLLCNLHIELTCSIDVNWGKFIKESVSAVAGSYVAGYLFYILSVLIPQSKRLPPIFCVIDQQLLYAKSSIEELSFLICENYEVKPSDFKEKLKSREFGESIEVSQQNCRFILQTINHVRLLLEYPMSKTELLYQEDLENLTEVTRIVSWIISRIMDVKPNSMLFDKKGYQEFVDGIVKVYELLDSSYTRLKKYNKNNNSK